MCQRYYYRFTKSLGLSYTISTPLDRVEYPTVMRATPTLDSSNNSYAVGGGAAGTVAVYNQTGAPLTTGAAFFYNSDSNWTAQNLVAVTAGLSAEL